MGVDFAVRTLVQPVKIVELVENVESVKNGEPVEKIQSVENVEPVKNIEHVENFELVENVEPVEIVELVDKYVTRTCNDKFQMTHTVQYCFRTVNQDISRQVEDNLKVYFLFF